MSDDDDRERQHELAVGRLPARGENLHCVKYSKNVREPIRVWLQGSWYRSRSTPQPRAFRFVSPFAITTRPRSGCPLPTRR